MDTLLMTVILYSILISASTISEDTKNGFATPPHWSDNAAMYIIAIGWLYVTVLMAITETSVVAGILTFLFYGLLPVSLLVWLLSTPVRRQRQRYKAALAAEQENETTAAGAVAEVSDRKHPEANP